MSAGRRHVGPVPEPCSVQSSGLAQRLTFKPQLLWWRIATSIATADPLASAYSRVEVAATLAATMQNLYRD